MFVWVVAHTVTTPLHIKTSTDTTPPSPSTIQYRTTCCKTTPLDPACDVRMLSPLPYREKCKQITRVPPSPPIPASFQMFSTTLVTPAVDTAYYVLTGTDRYQVQVFRSPQTPLWGSNPSSSLSSDPRDPEETCWGSEPGVGSLRRRRSPSLNTLMPAWCRSAPGGLGPSYMSHRTRPRLKFRHHTTPDVSSLLLHPADRSRS